MSPNYDIYGYGTDAAELVQKLFAGGELTPTVLKQDNGITVFSVIKLSEECYLNILHAQPQPNSFKVINEMVDKNIAQIGLYVPKGSKIKTLFVLPLDYMNDMDGKEYLSLMLRTNDYKVVDVKLDGVIMMTYGPGTWLSSQFLFAYNAIFRGSTSLNILNLGEYKPEEGEYTYANYFNTFQDIISTWSEKSKQ